MNKTGLRLLLFTLLFSTTCFSQINTSRVLAIGRNALYFEDYVLSIQYFNQVIRVKPHLAEPYFYRAIAKISLDDYKGAEEDCSLALERNPFLVEAYRCRGIARIYLEQYDAAMADFDQGLEFSPDNQQLLLAKGYASAQSENYPDAIKNFSIVIDRYPRFKEAYINRGYAYMANEDTLSALNDFEKVLEMDHFNANALAARAIVRYSRKEYNLAITDIDEAIRIEPYKAGYYINRGLIRYHLNNLRGAMDDYDHVIQLDPYNTMAYYNRGILRTEVGDKNRALADFDRVIELEPNNHFAIYNRGILESELGELNKAIKDFTTIIEEYPDFFPAYYNRGDAKRKKFDKAGAEKDYNTGMLLSQRKISREEINAQKTRKKSDKNLQNHNKLVTADKDEEEKRLTYRSESRGKVQNVNFNIDPEKNVQLTLYPQKQENSKRLSYFDKNVSRLNQSGKLTHPLYLTSHEYRISKDNSEVIFQGIEQFTQKIEKESNAYNYMQRALLFEAIYDFESAIEDWGKAIEKSVESEKWIYHFGRGNSRFRKLEYELSLRNEEVKEEENAERESDLLKIQTDMIIRDYEKACSLNETFSYSWYNKGNMLSLQKDYLNAIASYTTAIEKDSDLAEAYFNRGLCYLRINENQKGISDLSKAGELGLYVAYNVIKRFRE